MTQLTQQQTIPANKSDKDKVDLKSSKKEHEVEHSRNLTFEKKISLSPVVSDKAIKIPNGYGCAEVIMSGDSLTSIKYYPASLGKLQFTPESNTPPKVDVDESGKMTILEKLPGKEVTVVCKK